MRINNLWVFVPLLLISVVGYSQDFNSTSQHQNYLEFDPSKSFQGNELIDRLHFLISNSEEVELPVEVVNHLNAVQDEPIVHTKLTYMRASVLKVIYNERISPNDKKFICEHYLNSSNENYKPILPILQNYLKNLSH
jgi:hypothetical protein